MRRNPVATFGVAAALCAMIASVYAATTMGSLEPTAGTWRAYRGSGFTTPVCTASSEAAALACATADAERRATTTRYQIRYPNRYVTATYSAPATANRAPTISGTPVATIQVGQAYSFQPTASDPDGDALTFSITNKPEWAQFDAATGRLSGTPGVRNDGYHTGISITVSDGQATVSREFSVMVKPATDTPTTPDPPPVTTGTGTATLSWTAPTANTDGAALTDLAGYRVSYGSSAAELTQTIQLPDPGAKMFVVKDLAPGTYYFAVKAYNKDGGESAASNVVSKVVM